eukprot:GEMP01030991.1.p1 GENE.GEMP01030991.1~~GEMP01030991.1.p1  ORF type:complete len:370 (+),score=88.83 GEMP01030991.1:83-1192(+)
MVPKKKRRIASPKKAVIVIDSTDDEGAQAASSSRAPLQGKKKHRMDAQRDDRLWVDKYRPTSLEELSYHPDLTAKLKCVSEFKDFPHLLFQGPSGAGKMTRVRALLRAIFGDGAMKVTTDVKEVKVTKTTTADVEALHSKCHMELNLYDMGIRDAGVCKTFLKEYASTPPPTGAAFKVVVLKGADSLTHAAQAALRRLMEVHVSNCRFFLVCETASHLIGPLQSRCLCFRVAAPSCETIQDILQKVLEREKALMVPPQVLLRIANETRRDLRKALIRIETMIVNGSVVDAPFIPPWEAKIKKIASDLLDKKKHNPRTVLAMRNTLFELLQGSVQPDVILEHVTREIGMQCPKLFGDIYFLAATYEPLMK